MPMPTTPARPAGTLTDPAVSTTVRTRLIRAAGAGYVIAWVIGLLTGPSGPDATAPDAVVRTFYAEHGPGVLVQSALVHGVAAVCLASLALGIPSVTHAPSRLRRLVAGLGLAAALVSLLQVALAALAVASGPDRSPGDPAAMFDTLNRADTVKLVLIAGFAVAVAVAARRAGAFPRWLAGLTAALVVLLPLGGAAFLVESPALIAALYASLPLLLVWVGAVTAVVTRGARPGQRPV